MNRSTWKIPHVKWQLEKASIYPPSNKKNQNHQLVAYERAATITPVMLHKTILVHNGYRLVPLKVTENHIGFKLGQFAFTKKRVLHKKKKR